MRALVAAFCMSLLAGAASAAELQGKLTMTGSSTVAPLTLEIAKCFEKLHPKVRIDVQTGGSSRGVADARQGAADVGLVSRELSSSESDLVAQTIAWDGVAVVVHRDNAIAELTSDQIVAIYTGKTTSWKDVGGKDARITVVSKADGRSTLELFAEHFRLEKRAIKAHVVIGDNEQGIKTVLGNVNAIGYVSIGAAEHAVGRGEPLKLLPLGGVAPTTEAVANRTFPLARPLNLVTKGPARGLAKAFVDYAASPAVHDLVRGLSFAPAAPSPRS